jgi:outer membrane protein insertion porin family
MRLKMPIAPMRRAGDLLIFILVALWFAAAAPTVHAETLPWDGQPRPITQISIAVDDPHPDDFDWQGLARVLVNMAPGDTLTAGMLESAEEALAQFALARSRVEAVPPGVRVFFVLRPYKLIHTIDIRGNYPLFERDVRNAMTIAPGDFFDAAILPDQEALIAQRFRAEGYVDPRVRISWRQRPSDGHYQIAVVIHKGPHYTLDEVQPRGNRFRADSGIRMRMASWRRSRLGFGTARFRAEQIRDDVRRLTAFYRRKGFADVVITEQTVMDDQSHQAVCELTISEGPRYEIGFAGNQFFSDRALRRQMVLREVGNRGNIGLRRSQHNIRRRYLKAGFADVGVRWRDDARTENGQAVREIIFEIDEGPRHIVEAVHIADNTRIDTETLRRQILTRPPTRFRAGAYVAEVLVEDLVAIRTLYQSRGYLDVRAEEALAIDPETGRVTVAITIAEGPQTRVGTIEIEGDAPVAPARLKPSLVLGPGDPYLPVKRQEDEDRLAAQIAASGYPHAQAGGTASLSTDHTRADIVYTIDTGPLVHVGEVFFLGNFRTRDRFMRREMDLAPRAPFALQKVWEAQRGMRDLNIFDSVHVRTIGLKERADTVHLLVQAAEQKPYYLETGAGYQTDKGVYGRAQIGDRNFLGTAKEIRASVEASEVGYRWETGISEPRLLGSRIRADAGVFGERSEPFNQQFGTHSTGANLNFTRRWGRSYTTALAMRYERREQFLRGESETTAEIDPETLAPRAILTATPFVQFDSRDTFIRPRAGHLASVAVDISKGLDNVLDDFLKYRFDVRTYYTPVQRLTLAARAWLGILEPYGGDALPLDQLFFLGGTHAVRGFGENLLRFDAEGNPVGGRLGLAASLEGRIDIGRNFELVPFVDTGGLWQVPLDAGSDTLRWAAGLGLQYITPIGPIGLFYGHKLDRRPGESSGQWHFSIGYTF